MTRSIQDQLRALEQAAASGAAKAVEAIATALNKSTCRVAKRAAELAAELKIEELLAALESAFHRFCKNANQSDPGCVAKTAIVDALRSLYFDDEDFFVAACRYHQYEPVWGGDVDTAAELRVLAAFGLVEMNSRLALPILVDLLVDREKTCRAGAARALAATQLPAAQLLLRLKAHHGDPEPQVLGECLTGLLDIAQVEALPIVIRYLDDEKLDNRLEAGIALGTSRQPEALVPLQRRYRLADLREEKRILLTAIAILQSEAAIEFVLEQVKSKEFQIAADALHALSHVRDQQAIKERLRPLMTASRQHPDVQAAYDEYFGSA